MDIKKTKFTEKQLNFIAEYKANGGEGLEAYQKAFGGGSVKAMRDSLSRLLQKPNIYEELKDVMKRKNDAVILCPTYFRAEYLELYEIAKSDRDIMNARAILKELEKFKSKTIDEKMVINISFGHQYEPKVITKNDFYDEDENKEDEGEE